MIILRVLKFSGFSQKLNKEQYLNKIDVLKNHINRGDVYEANFCFEWFSEHAKINPLYVYKNLNKISKSPMSVYFKNKELHLICSSPERYLKKYPADKNVIYAHYLIALIHFEQITDEKKDMEPVLKAKEKIDFFLNEFPDSDYAIDLQFKRDLVINQMAAKELFVAKYYVSIQKWVPAINRLKIIVKKFDASVAQSFLKQLKKHHLLFE